MALIGKIRERSGLLVAIVGIALLAFILNDYDKIFGSWDEQLGYGTVYGEMVDAAAYEEASRKFEEQDRMQFMQQQREYGQRDQEASLDKAFNYVVETTIFEREYEALGIDVSDTEFEAYLFGTDGFQVLPELAQGFTDS
ncbi:MAG: SurA N-terminal domain-containing protein, partial [Bacteroidota bacterium]